MANEAFLVVIFILLTTLVLPRVTVGDSRGEIVQMTCTNQQQVNSSSFVTNFVTSMENISAQVQTQGYGVAIAGRGPDTFHGLAQCYGDLSEVDCVLCISQARNSVSECFPSNGAKMFLDGCFLRTGNVSFFHEYTGPEDRAICGNRSRKSSAFQEIARRAVLQAALDAPNNNGYARVEMRVSGTSDESAYVLANCWRTLNVGSCRACLENASASMLGCLPWSEGRALNTGCFMRYSDINFLNHIPSNGSSGGTATVVIAVAVSSTIVVAMAAAIGAYIWNHMRIEKKRKGSHDAAKMAKALRDSSLNFKYSIIEKATGGFGEDNKIGQGGFGTVYKGTLPDGREIAVKRLFLNTMHNADDFYNEINMISSLEHKNLVRLLGCSCTGPESLLIYEFLPKKSLDRFIYNSDLGKFLNWEKRFGIITGIAEGLIYLHQNSKIRIIHRDIKASNILLDMKLSPKIADFGLARSLQEDRSHISTAIAGTLGYMAPEYFAHGKLTEKTDVYSFGVLVLEIITGRQNNGSTTSEYSESLITIAWRHFQQGTVEELIDPNVMLHNDNNISVKIEILRVFHVAFLCTQEIPSLRPFMSKALEMLTKKDELLPPPTKPPFIDERTMEFNVTAENSPQPLITSGNSDSVAHMSQSIFYPR